MSSGISQAFFPRVCMEGLQTVARKLQESLQHLKFGRPDVMPDPSPLIVSKQPFFQAQKRSGQEQSQVTRTVTPGGAEALEAQGWRGADTSLGGGYWSPQGGTGIQDRRVAAADATATTEKLRGDSHSLTAALGTLVSQQSPADLATAPQQMGISQRARGPALLPSRCLNSPPGQTRCCFSSK